MLQQLQPMVSAKVSTLEAEATGKNCKWVSGEGRDVLAGTGRRRGVLAAGQGVLIPASAQVLRIRKYVYEPVWLFV